MPRDVQQVAQRRAERRNAPTEVLVVLLRAHPELDFFAHHLERALARSATLLHADTQRAAVHRHPLHIVEMQTMLPEERVQRVHG